MVGFRHEPPRRRVLASAGNGQLAFGLKQLQRIGGAFRALLLGNSEDLVFEIRFAQVEERLPGHGGVFDALLFRDEREHRFHERRLARRAGALDDHAQRLVELARERGQIANQFIRVLADDAAGVEVGQDAVEQLRIAQQGQSFVALLFCHAGDFRLPGLQSPADRFFLQLFELEQQAREVALDDIFFERGFERGHAREVLAFLGAGHVHVVLMIAVIVDAHAQVDLERVEAGVLGKTAHSVFPVADLEEQVFAALLGVKAGAVGSGQLSRRRRQSG